MFKNTFFYIAAYAFPGVLGFLSFGVYTRVLTPSEYAVYSVGVSVAFLVGNVCFGWVRFSVSRFQAEYPSANFLPFAVACILVVALLFGPLITIAVLSVLTVPALATFGVVTMAVGQALFDVTQEIRRARHEALAFTKANIARAFIGIGLSVSAAAYFHQGAALLFGTAAGFFIVGLAFILKSSSKLRREDLSRALIRRFVFYGMPLALSGLVFAGNATLARVLVTSQLGSVAGGQYGAGLDVTGQLTTMLAGSVCSVMGPAAIFAFGNNGLEAARDELSKGFDLMLGLIVPTVVGLALVSGPFAAVASGNQFSGTVGQILPLLIVSRGLNVFAQFYLHLGFQIVEKPIRQVICGGATLLANVGLMMALMRYFGLQGAAVALVAADLFGVAVSFLLLANVFPMPFPLRSVFRVGVATLVMAVVCRLEQMMFQGPAILELAATSLVGILVYGSFVFMFDIAHARTLLSRRSPGT